MYARLATFSVGEGSGYEEMSERIRDAAQPIIEEIPGWQGATQMLDRENGTVAILHLFDSEENMQAAESTFETMPERFPDDLRERMQAMAGGRQSVQRFEVLGETRR
jgi:hypothetical protein